MNKPSALARAKTALEVFRFGYEGRPKELPSGISEPSWRQIEPQWHLTDFTAYVYEGFSLNSLVYSAIMYKVRAVIPAPLRAYTGDPDYPQVLQQGNPLSELVARPNEHQSWTEFQSQNIVYLNLDGNVFIVKDRKNRAMHSLRPDRVYIIPTKARPAKLLGFLYIPEGGTRKDGIPILPEDMIHIKLPFPGDPLEGMGYGLSPLSAGAQCADVDNIVTEFLNVFFKKGTMLTGVLSFDVPLKDSVVDGIIERWEQKYGGYEKWKVGVLDRGGKYQRTALTFEEMGFGQIDARNECRILGPFGVPPILIGSRVGLERSTYSNYEGARKAVWEDTLLPEIRLFEVEYQYNLKGRNAFVKFDLSQVPALQKDLPITVNAAYSLWQMGVPANQALAAVGLRIGEVPNGNLPYAGAPPRLPAQQGSRTDAGTDSWGMRSMRLECEDCGGNLEFVEGFKRTNELPWLLRCPHCDQLTLYTGNGRSKIEENHLLSQGL